MKPLFVALVLITTASPLGAEIIDFRCKPADKERSELDVWLRLDTQNKAVISHGYWEHSYVLFWEDEYIGWTSVQSSPNERGFRSIAAVMFDRRSNRLDVGISSSEKFGPNAILSRLPPSECYRVGF